MKPEAIQQFRPTVRIPDGLSAEELRKSLDGIPSTLQGMRSPMGEPSRSECVAGMDMLNDMFQRQARRLESQLYQRAQDQRTIEVAQRQTQLAMAKVRQLEQQHNEQVAWMQHSTQSLQKLQHQMREAQNDHELALNTCEALERDVLQLRDVLQTESPQTAERLRLHCAKCPPVEQLRQKAVALEKAVKETERSALENVGATPTTSYAMSSAGPGSGEAMDEQPSNPLHDLSVIADYASKARVSQAIMGSPLSSATRSLSCEQIMDRDRAMDVGLPSSATSARGL